MFNTKHKIICEIEGLDEDRWTNDILYALSDVETISLKVIATIKEKPTTWVAVILQYIK